MLPSPSSSSSSTFESRPARGKPIKLRAACTQCHAAKVKCTGERNGCERCQTLQLSCVYMESRVGRVAGMRARQRNVQQQPSTRQYSTHTHDNSPVQAGSRAIQTDSRAISTTTSTTTSDGSCTSSQWLVGGSVAGSDVESLGTNNDLNAGPGASATDTDMLLPPMDFNLDDMLHYPAGTTSYPSGTNDFGFLSPPQEDSAEDEAKRLAELDSQCVLVCCQLATELESCKVANVKSLQIVLGIVKKAVERLADMVRLQQESRSFKCMAMFGVLVYQIIELLESGCACFLDTSKEDSFTAQVHGMLPGLSFGYLTMGPKEQASWRSHIVLREIRQTSELLQKIKKLSAVGEPGANHGARAQSERERCFNDLENRLKALSAEVTSHE